MSTEAEVETQEKPKPTAPRSAKKDDSDARPAGNIKDMTTAEMDEDELDRKTPPDVTGITPLGVWLVVWPAHPEKYQGKIHLLEGSMAGPNEGKAPSQGVVLLVGDKVNDPEESDVQITPGQIVHFWKHAGSWEWINGKQVRVMQRKDVFGVSEKETE